MIDIVYNRKKHRLKVRGHADAAPKGEDIVCAAATILVRTLAEDCEAAKNTGALEKATSITEEGNAYISVTAKAGYESIATLIFDSVCNGLRLLAREYPEYVKYKII